MWHAFAKLTGILAPPALWAALALAQTLGAAAGAPARAEDRVLMAVQERGFVRCGVHRSGVGLAEIRADGGWAGLFVEACRVIALAALGDGRAIQVYEVDDLSAGLALATGHVDVVTSTILKGEGAARAQGLAQLAPVLEDRQMLVSFRPEVAGVADLPPGARVCASNHPTIRSNLDAALGNHASDVQIVGYDSVDGLFNAFFRQRCDALSYHHYAILAQGLLRSPQRTAIWASGFDLGRIVFGPTVRNVDPEWIAIVDAAVRAATHDASLQVGDIPFRVRDGFIERVRSIANSSTSIYDRTLGHLGGQGFYPAVAGLPAG